MLAPIESITLQGSPAWRLHSANGTSAVVLQRGAQVISWIHPLAGELLYCSPASNPLGSQPLRGGIPIIFPQFGNRGPLERHGFARMADWKLDAIDQSTTAPRITLRLQVHADMHPLWAHACECFLEVALSHTGLQIQLTVCNLDDTPLQFTTALHSYFAVDNTACACIRGLFDNGKALFLQGAIDQIFHAVRRPVDLLSGTACMHINQTGFTDVVVWNPGPQAVLSDLPADAYRKFVCIESAMIDPPVRLSPQAQWHGQLKLFLREHPRQHGTL